MRIMIDFTQIPVSRTGVGVYAENLVREIIPLLGSGDSLFVLVQSDEPLSMVLLGSKAVRFIKIPSHIFRNRAALFVFEQVILPIVLLIERVEILHSLHYTHPLLSPCPRVVTIHDLTFLLFPELHTRGRRLIMPFFIRHAIRHADAVIFVSESSRKDAERLIPGGRGLRAVVRLGVDPKYSAQATSDEIRATLEKLSLSCPFILNIGTIEPRKNLIRLVRAFEHLADCHEDINLVLAGKLGWDYGDALAQMRDSRHAQRIRHIGFISENEKRALLNCCEVFVYPSLYEGFGLPVLEAMAAGAPVITSANSSLSEVAGDAAVLVDPTSLSNLSTAIAALIRDDVKKARLSAKGKSRSSLFTWISTAHETYNLYVRLNVGLENRHT